MNFDTNIILENKRVRLEPLSWDHFEKLLPIAIKHPKLLQYSPDKFGSEIALKSYFEKNIKLQKQKIKCPFVIYDKLNNAYAGSTSFMNISTKDKRLEIGSTWLAEDFQRTGLNRNCKFLLLQYAFEILEFERVELKTDQRNEKSKQAILAIGAQYEGTLRSHTVLSDDYRRDTVYYSILKKEWNSIKHSIFKNNII